MKRELHDCLTHCVAYYFRINPARVPFFIAHKDWIKRLKRFYKRRGLEIHYYPYNARMIRYMRKHKSMMFIVQGESHTKPKKGKRRIEHAVVYRGHSPLFDPSPKQRFLLGKPIWVWIAYKKKPA